MAYSANPNLFVESFGGGLRTGTALTDLIRRKRDDRELQRLAQLAKQGQYEDLGAGLIGMGEVGPGIAATNVPFNREQQRIETERLAGQQKFENDFKLASLGLQQAQATKPSWKVSDGIAYNESDPTQTMPLPNAEPTGLFDGNSVQAQALNGLVRTGKITEEQAFELAAGKTITNPDGSVWFLGASGLVPNAAPNTFDPNRFIPAPPAPGTEVSAVQPQGAIPDAPARQLTPPKPVQATEGQNKAAGYAQRIRASLPIIDDPEVLKAATSYWEAAKGKTRLSSAYLNSEAYKKFKQAALDIATAILRPESGAVIGEEEAANVALQYLPAPGDTPAVIKQKRDNLMVKLAGLEREAGPAYKPETGDPELDAALNKYGK